MIKTNKLPKLFLIALISLNVYNCVGVKPATSGKASKYVEDFFLGDGKMQYFVKSLDYISTTEDEASLDATFRRADKKNDSVTVNFSVLLKSNADINTATIESSKNEYTTEAIKTFFIEKDKEKIKHRVSIKMSFADYQKHLLNPEHTIEVTSEDDSSIITPTKKSNQKLEPIKALLENLL